MGKRVVAVAGDRVEVQVVGVRVNEKLLAGSMPRTTDSAGRRMMPFGAGELEIMSGHVWLMSEHSKSWDSRYYGPVSMSSVIRVEPVRVGEASF